MELKVLKSGWGFYHIPLREMVKKIADSGFDGLENRMQTEPDKISELKDLLQEFDLIYQPMLFPTGVTPDDQLKSFRQNLELAAEYKPFRVNAHIGADYWEVDDNVSIYKAALEMCKDFDFEVAFETHRRRPMYSAWSAYRILARVPELRINADFSHFLVVGESDGREFDDLVDYCCQRAIHIHGRVSYSQGPQVPDPRAPEYKPFLETFTRWWKRIIVYRYQDKTETFTFHPEYGPFPYCHTLPYTNQPVCDTWEIAEWVGEYFKGVFAETMKEIESGDLGTPLGADKSSRLQGGVINP